MLNNSIQLPFPPILDWDLGRFTFDVSIEPLHGDCPYYGGFFFSERYFDVRIHRYNTIKTLNNWNWVMG